MDVHAPQFERNTRTGEWRGWCRCGWFMRGTEAEVTAKAAVHDLEWESVETTATEGAHA